MFQHPAFEKSNVELLSGLRSNFAASREASTIVDHVKPNGVVNGCNVANGDHTSYSSWTSVADSTLHIPSKIFQTRGLFEERSQYDITVKLFLLPQASFSDWRQHLHEAIAAVLEELNVESIDLFIISFPGVIFDPDSERRGGCGSATVAASEAELLDAVIEAWKEVEILNSKGIALRIGLAEFDLERLQKLLPRVTHRPTVDQINVRGCHVLPESMMQFSKQENLELLTHNDCTNILPQSTLRELLGDGEKGAGVLAGSGSEGKSLRGNVIPQWVVKYTAVVRDRGVIENKGYFASAELAQ